MEKALLHLLGQQPPILGISVGVEVCDHPGLCVACIALDGLDVASADLELDGSAVVPEAVKYHRRKVVRMDKATQLLRDLPLLRGPSIFVSENKVEVLVGFAQKGLFLLLAGNPLREGIPLLESV